MYVEGRVVGVLGSPLRVQLFLLVAGVLAGWALRGDGPRDAVAHHPTHPPISNEIVDGVLGFGAVLFIAAILFEVLRTADLDRRWYAPLFVTLTIGWSLGAAIRTLGSATLGTTIDVIFVISMQLPVLAALAVAVALWTGRLALDLGPVRHTVRSPMWSQARLLLSGALATWWLVGDLGTAPPTGRAKPLEPSLSLMSMLPRLDALVGAVALALAAATLLAVATTAARGRWLAQFLGAFGVGAGLGFLARLLTAGGMGAPLGGSKAVLMLVGVPLLAAATLALGWRTTRLLRV